MHNKSTIHELIIRIPRGEIVLRDDRIKKEWKVEIDNFLLFIKKSNDLLRI